MTDETCEEFIPPYFTPTLLAVDPYPAGFETWVSNITQDKYRLFLPDGTNLNAKIFMDLNGNWESGNYTKYLLNRYAEL